MTCKQTCKSTTLFANLDDLKAFLTWCRCNGIPHIEIDNLKADIILEQPQTPNQPYQPTNLDYIPQFSPDFVADPTQIEEINS
jgi:hypothetical protein